MTNSNLPERLKKVRKALGNLTQPTFAAGIGVSRATIASIETGRSKLTFDQLQAIYNVYNINPAYLLTGSGEIFASGIADENQSDSLAVSEPLTPYGSRGSTLVTIAAQAGYSEGGQLRDDQPVVRIPGFQDDNSRVFEVSGESMDPVLNHCDYIICDRLLNSRELRDGLIYVVVSRNHGVTVKYVRLTLDALRCTPHNTQNFDAFNVPLDEVIELWEVRARITRNVLGNFIESIPARIQNRFERLERVMDNLLSERDRPK